MTVAEVLFALRYVITAKARSGQPGITIRIEDAEVGRAIGRHLAHAGYSYSIETDIALGNCEEIMFAGIKITWPKASWR